MAGLVPNSSGPELTPPLNRNVSHEERVAPNSPHRPDQSDHGFDQVERWREDVILHVFATLQNNLSPRQLELLFARSRTTMEILPGLKLYEWFARDNLNKAAAALNLLFFEVTAGY